MIRIECCKKDWRSELDALCNRPAYPPAAEKAAAEIIADIRTRGVEAICEYAEKFDHVKLTFDQFRISEEEIEAAAGKVSAGNKKAIRTACRQVRAFAKETLPRNWKKKIRDGVIVGEQFNPLDRVGVYIPGGTAPLVSTVLHTAAIAKACGVKEIVAITPAGGVHPETLFAMKCAGVTEIYRLGGIYGVAAITVGVPGIPKVQKLVGPGNAYVTAAKKLLYGEVGIDLVAGPSEILIIADKDANPEFIAADLLSQAEHGSGLEQAVLVSTDAALFDAVEKACLRQKSRLSREEIIDRVWEKGVFFINVPDLDRAAEVANLYAPEHLEVQCAEPEKMLPKLKAAGAVFLGPWTPEPVGDFCAGPSHVLPTASSALRFNGLESVSFFRRTSIVKYSKSALKREVEVVERFGAMEKLTAHGMAGTVRFLNEK
ncbi:MAG: histidinol dehydrogenase [Lentisphaeria bacterium]|nr:histidinol dehydrogenase [Lentisphaeria bacterium]